MIEDDLSMETVRRVKRGETFDPELRVLGVFVAERRGPNYIWIRASVFERGRFFTSSWQCHTEDEAVKWFNAYTELYGPPKRGEFSIQCASSDWSAGRHLSATWRTN